MEPQYKTSYSDLLVSVQHGNTILKKQFREARNKQELPAYVQSRITSSHHHILCNLQSIQKWTIVTHWITLHYIQISPILNQKKEHKKSLFCKLIKVGIHDLGYGFKKCWFLHARKQGVLGLTYNLLNYRFLVQIFSTHDASNCIGSETSLNPFLQQHGGNAKCSCTLKWNIPSIVSQKLYVFFSIQRIDIFNCLGRVRLTCLRPVKPIKCAIFKLQKKPTTWVHIQSINM